MSGTRKPKPPPVAALLVKALSVTAAPLRPKNAGAVASNVNDLWVAGSSSESVPEKPLPKSAV
jgi:hypothetical protein